jgi:TPP-dependent pyruvate/acetoin dehydrogenase alpha subunit
VAPRTPAAQLSADQLLGLHRDLWLNRLFEERLSLLFRQGRVVGGVYRSLGQEACSVGSAHALADGDLVAPMIRNIGTVLVRGVRPRILFSQYLGRQGAPARGRDGGVHLAQADEHGGGLFPISSLLGQMIPILVGAVLADRMQGKTTVALNYIGDGGMATGAFHEGFNLACATRAPLVLIAENNRYAYSTPTARHTANVRLRDRAAAYGAYGASVDGTDILAVYEATRLAMARARRGDGPTLIEADVMRRAGHAEHDDGRYVPPELLEEWRTKDPIERYERWLIEQRVATAADLAGRARQIDSELDQELAGAEEQPAVSAHALLDDVMADGPAVSGIPPLIARWRRAAGRD